MRNEYTTPEIIEIGSADEVILGEKLSMGPDIGQPNFVENDLDD